MTLYLHHTWIAPDNALVIHGPWFDGSAAPSGPEGSGTVTAPAVTSAGVGKVIHQGSGTVTTPTVESDGASRVIHQGSGTVLLPPVEADGVGTAGGFNPNTFTHFTSIGTFFWNRTTYDVPLGTLVRFQSWGGGGAGGGPTGGNDNSGGGGGGGGYASQVIAIDQDEYTVTIGAGGDGPTATGGTASDTYDGTDYVSRATGGTAGGSVTPGTGGAGTVGTDQRTGGAGGAGGTESGMGEIGGGGGGASAGGNAGSSPTNFAGAAGGTSTSDVSFAGGAGGNAPSGTGVAGTAPGGGGGGGGNRGSNFGGNGARGQVTVSWYQAPVTPSGTGSVVLPTVESSGDANLVHHGQATITMPGVESVGAAVLVHPGSATVTLPGIESAGIGHVIHISSSTVLVPAVESDGDGTATSGSPTPVGTGSAILPSAETEGTGYLIHQGFSILDLPPVETSGMGMMTHFGTSTTTLPAVESAGVGHVIHLSNGTITLPAVESEGAGTSTSPPSETQTGEGAVLLPPVTAAGEGHVIHVGSSTILLPAVVTNQPNLPVTTGLVWNLDAREITVANNEQVPSWSDISSSSNHVAQATSLKQPIYRLGQTPSGGPTVTFDGTNDDLRTSTTPITGSTNRTIYVVYRQSSSHVGSRPSPVSMSPEGTSLPAGSRFGITTEPGVRVITGYRLWQPGVTADSWELLVIQLSGGTVNGLSAWRNRSALSVLETGTGTTAINTLSGGASVGLYNILDEWFNGDVSHILAYTGAHTTEQREAVEDYLYEVWFDSHAHIIHLGTGDVTLPPVESSGSGLYMGLLPGTVSIVSRSPIIVATTTEATGGEPPYSYQWQRSPDCETWVNMSDATEGVSGSTTMTLEDGSAEEGVTYCYRVVVTDSTAPTPIVAFSNSISTTLRTGWGLRDPRSRTLRIEERTKEGFGTR